MYIRTVNTNFLFCTISWHHSYHSTTIRFLVYLPEDQPNKVLDPTNTKRRNARIYVRRGTERTTKESYQ